MKRWKNYFNPQNSFLTQNKNLLYNFWVYFNILSKNSDKGKEKK